MSSKKEERKKLKQPDTFQKEMFQLGDWVIKNQKTLISVIAPIVGIAVVIILWGEFTQYKKQTRLDALGQIDLVYEDEREAAGKLIEKLQEQLSEVTKKEAELASSLEEGNETTPEIIALAGKKKEIEEKIGDVKPDHSKSLEQYKAYTEENSGNAEGWRSSLMAINILRDQKKYKEADELLAPVIKESTSIRFYQTHVRLMYISLLEENGKLDQALKETELLLSIVGDDKDLEAKALLAKGRLFLLSDKQQEAFQAFDTLITKHEASQEARKAIAIKNL